MAKLLRPFYKKALTSKKTVCNATMHAHTKKHSRHSPRAKIKCSLVITINRKGDGLPESRVQSTRKTTSNKNIINKITRPTINREEGRIASQWDVKKHIWKSLQQEDRPMSLQGGLNMLLPSLNTEAECNDHSFSPAQKKKSFGKQQVNHSLIVEKRFLITLGIYYFPELRYNFPQSIPISWFFF